MFLHISPGILPGVPLGRGGQPPLLATTSPAANRVNGFHSVNTRVLDTQFSSLGIAPHAARANLPSALAAGGSADALGPSNHRDGPSDSPTSDHEFQSSVDDGPSMGPSRRSLRHPSSGPSPKVSTHLLLLAAENAACLTSKQLHELVRAIRHAADDPDRRFHLPEAAVGRLVRELRSRRRMAALLDLPEHSWDDRRQAAGATVAVAAVSAASLGRHRRGSAATAAASLTAAAANQPGHGPEATSKGSPARPCAAARRETEGHGLDEVEENAADTVASAASPSLHSRRRPRGTNGAGARDVGAAASSAVSHRLLPQTDQRVPAQETPGVTADSGVPVRRRGSSRRRGDSSFPEEQQQQQEQQQRPTQATGALAADATAPTTPTAPAQGTGRHEEGQSGARQQGLPSQRGPEGGAAEQAEVAAVHQFYAGMDWAGGGMAAGEALAALEACVVLGSLPRRDTLEALLRTVRRAASASASVSASASAATAMVGPVPQRPDARGPPMPQRQQLQQQHQPPYPGLRGGQHEGQHEAQQDGGAAGGAAGRAADGAAAPGPRVDGLRVAGWAALHAGDSHGAAAAGDVSWDGGGLAAGPPSGAPQPGGRGEAGGPPPAGSFPPAGTEEQRQKLEQQQQQQGLGALHEAALAPAPTSHHLQGKAVLLPRPRRAVAAASGAAAVTGAGQGPNGAAATGPSATSCAVAAAGPTVGGPDSPRPVRLAAGAGANALQHPPVAVTATSLASAPEPAIAGGQAFAAATAASTAAQPGPSLADPSEQWGSTSLMPHAAFAATQQPPTGRGSALVRSGVPSAAASVAALAALPQPLPPSRLVAVLFGLTRLGQRLSQPLWRELLAYLQPLLTLSLDDSADATSLPPQQRRRRRPLREPQSSSPPPPPPPLPLTHYDLVDLATSLAAAGCNPSTPFLAAHAAAVKGWAAHLTGRQAARLLWSYASLDYRPPPAVLGALAATVRAQVGTVQAADLARAAQALVLFAAGVAAAGGREGKGAATATATAVAARAPGYGGRVPTLGPVPYLRDAAAACVLQHRRSCAAEREALQKRLRLLALRHPPQEHHRRQRPLQPPPSRDAGRHQTGPQDPGSETDGEDVFASLEEGLPLSGDPRGWVPSPSLMFPGAVSESDSGSGSGSSSGSGRNVASGSVSSAIQEEGIQPGGTGRSQQIAAGESQVAVSEREGLAVQLRSLEQQERFLGWLAAAALPADVAEAAAAAPLPPVPVRNGTLGGLPGARAVDEVAGEFPHGHRWREPATLAAAAGWTDGRSGGGPAALPDDITAEGLATVARLAALGLPSLDAAAADARWARRLLCLLAPLAAVLRPTDLVPVVQLVCRLYSRHPQLLGSTGQEPPGDAEGVSAGRDASAGAAIDGAAMMALGAGGAAAGPPGGKIAGRQVRRRAVTQSCQESAELRSTTAAITAAATAATSLHTAPDRPEGPSGALRALIGAACASLDCLSHGQVMGLYGSVSAMAAQRGVQEWLATQGWGPEAAAAAVTAPPPPRPPQRPVPRSPPTALPDGPMGTSAAAAAASEGCLPPPLLPASARGGPPAAPQPRNDAALAARAAGHIWRGRGEAVALDVSSATRQLPTAAEVMADPAAWLLALLRPQGPPSYPAAAVAVATTVANPTPTPVLSAHAVHSATPATTSATACGTPSHQEEPLSSVPGQAGVAGAGPLPHSAEEPQLTPPPSSPPPTQTDPCSMQPDSTPSATAAALLTDPAPSAGTAAPLGTAPPATPAAALGEDSSSIGGSDLGIRRPPIPQSEPAAGKDTPAQLAWPAAAAAAAAATASKPAARATASLGVLTHVLRSCIDARVSLPPPQLQVVRTAWRQQLDLDARTAPPPAADPRVIAELLLTVAAAASAAGSERSAAVLELAEALGAGGGDALRELPPVQLADCFHVAAVAVEELDGSGGAEAPADDADHTAPGADGDESGDGGGNALARRTAALAGAIEPLLMEIERRVQMRSSRPASVAVAAASVGPLAAMPSQSFALVFRALSTLSYSRLWPRRLRRREAAITAAARCELRLPGSPLRRVVASQLAPLGPPPSAAAVRHSVWLLHHLSPPVDRAWLERFAAAAPAALRHVHPRATVHWLTASAVRCRTLPVAPPALRLLWGHLRRGWRLLLVDEMCCLVWAAARLGLRIPWGLTDAAVESAAVAAATATRALTRRGGGSAASDGSSSDGGGRLPASPPGSDAGAGGVAGQGPGSSHHFSSHSSVRQPAKAAAQANGILDNGLGVSARPFASRRRREPGHVAAASIVRLLWAVQYDERYDMPPRCVLELCRQLARAWPGLPTGDRSAALWALASMPPRSAAAAALRESGLGDAVVAHLEDTARTTARRPSRSSGHVVEPTPHGGQGPVSAGPRGQGAHTAVVDVAVVDVAVGDPAGGCGDVSDSVCSEMSVNDLARLAWALTKLRQPLPSSLAARISGRLAHAAEAVAASGAADAAAAAAAPGTPTAGPAANGVGVLPAGSTDGLGPKEAVQSLYAVSRFVLLPGPSSAPGQGSGGGGRPPLLPTAGALASLQPLAALVLSSDPRVLDIRSLADCLGTLSRFRFQLSQFTGCGRGTWAEEAVAAATSAADGGGEEEGTSPGPNQGATKGRQLEDATAPAAAARRSAVEGWRSDPWVMAALSRAQELLEAAAARGPAGRRAAPATCALEVLHSAKFLGVPVSGPLRDAVAAVLAAQLPTLTAAQLAEVMVCCTAGVAPLPSGLAWAALAQLTELEAGGQQPSSPLDALQPDELARVVAAAPQALAALTYDPAGAAGPPDSRPPALPPSAPIAESSGRSPAAAAPAAVPTSRWAASEPASRQGSPGREGDGSAEKNALELRRRRLLAERVATLACRPWDPRVIAMSADQLARLASGVVAAGAVPDRSWLLWICRRVRRQMGDASQHGLLRMCWALERAEVWPGEEWVESCLRQVAKLSRGRSMYSSVRHQIQDYVARLRAFGAAADTAAAAAGAVAAAAVASADTQLSAATPCAPAPDPELQAQYDNTPYSTCPGVHEDGLQGPAAPGRDLLPSCPPAPTPNLAHTDDAPDGFTGNATSAAAAAGTALAAAPEPLQTAISVPPGGLQTSGPGMGCVGAAAAPLVGHMASADGSGGGGAGGSGSSRRALVVRGKSGSGHSSLSLSLRRGLSLRQARRGQPGATEDPAAGGEDEGRAEEEEEEEEGSRRNRGTAGHVNGYDVLRCSGGGGGNGRSVPVTPLPELLSAEARRALGIVSHLHGAFAAASHAVIRLQLPSSLIIGGGGPAAPPAAAPPAAAAAAPSRTRAGSGSSGQDEAEDEDEGGTCEAGSGAAAPAAAAATEQQEVRGQPSVVVAAVAAAASSPVAVRPSEALSRLLLVYRLAEARMDRLMALTIKVAALQSAYVLYLARSPRQEEVEGEGGEGGEGRGEGEVVDLAPRRRPSARGRLSSRSGTMPHRDGGPESGVAARMRREEQGEGEGEGRGSDAPRLSVPVGRIGAAEVPLGRLEACGGSGGGPSVRVTLQSLAPMAEYLRRQQLQAQLPLPLPPPPPSPATIGSRSRQLSSRAGERGVGAPAGMGRRDRRGKQRGGVQEVGDRGMRVSSSEEGGLLACMLHSKYCSLLHTFSNLRG